VSEEKAEVGFQHADDARHRRRLHAPLARDRSEVPAPCDFDEELYRTDIHAETILAILARHYGV